MVLEIKNAKSAKMVNFVQAHQINLPIAVRVITVLTAVTNMHVRLEPFQTILTILPLPIARTAQLVLIAIERDCPSQQVRAKQAISALKAHCPRYKKFVWLDTIALKALLHLTKTLAAQVHTTR